MMMMMKLMEKQRWNERSLVARPDWRVAQAGLLELVAEKWKLDWLGKKDCKERAQVQG